MLFILRIPELSGLSFCKRIMPKEKCSKHCVDLEKAFDRVPRKVFEWAMMENGIPEVLVRYG